MLVRSEVTLAGTRYLLVEFPRMVAAEIVGRALGEVLQLGLVPVLAHPERYSSCSVEAARAWREMGAVLQVDATTLTLPDRKSTRLNPHPTAHLVCRLTLYTKQKN